MLRCIPPVKGGIRNDETTTIYRIKLGSKCQVINGDDTHVIHSSFLQETEVFDIKPASTEGVPQGVTNPNQMEVGISTRPGAFQPVKIILLHTLKLRPNSKAQARAPIVSDHFDDIILFNFRLKIAGISTGQ